MTNINQYFFKGLIMESDKDIADIKMKMMMGIKVPMRDGIELTTDIYLPEDKLPCPIILQRSPYNSNVEASVKEAVYLVKEGYGVILQDVRGRWDSEGEWYPFIHEAEDGYDTQEWIGSQEWCDGNIGTIGGSYLAMVQWQAAPLRSKYLKAMAPKVGYSDFYHNWVYTGGAFQLAFNLRWIAIQMHTRTNQVQYLWMPKSNHQSNIQWHLPLINMDEKAGRDSKIWKDWVSHPSYDDYWKKLNPIESNYDEVNVPTYGMGGWYDVFLQGTLNNYMGVKKHGLSPGKENQKVIIGPWIHFLANDGEETITGDIDFGENVKIDLFNERLKWFDYWLKGIDNGISKEPSVKVFVMGKNQWRTAPDWPIPETKYTKFYIHSGGSANGCKGDGILNINPPLSDEENDQFIYDPSDPVPTTGGSTCCSEDVTPVPMGPRKQKKIEHRNDILIYTTESLENDIEVTGPIEMILYASTDCKDTDFTCKLIDVFPDGKSINIAQGIQRARYRDSWENPELLDSGKIYKFTVDMWSSSNYFFKNHKIRIEITSSNFPQFDRNPNTGNEFGIDTELKIANQNVFHNKSCDSHIILPIVT